MKTPAQQVPETTGQGESTAKVSPPAGQTDGGNPVNEREINDIVNVLKNLKCDGFVEGGKKDDLKSPEYTVSLEGTKTYSLSLYRKNGDKRPAVSTGSDYPFYISSAKADRIMKHFETILKPVK